MRRYATCAKMLKHQKFWEFSALKAHQCCKLSKVPCMPHKASAVLAHAKNCTTSDRFKRFVFQRCRLLLVVNVKKSTLSANMRHCTVMKRSLDEQLFCKRQYNALLCKRVKMTHFVCVHVCMLTLCSVDPAPCLWHSFSEFVLVRRMSHAKVSAISESHVHMHSTLLCTLCHQLYTHARISDLSRLSSR